MLLHNSKIAIVSNFAVFHIGTHFLNAAKALGLCTYPLSIEIAFSGPKLLQKWNWWFRHHRPNQLENFSQMVWQTCLDNKVDYLLTTGIAPLNDKYLQKIKQLNIKCYNFLTDDPWNKTHYSPWFLRSIPHYDHIFSPRHGNISDLQKLGAEVSYLPFAYAPENHFPQSPHQEELDQFTCDVLFIGGADNDRVPYIKALIEAGFTVGLWGGYWNRYAFAKPFWQGHADPEKMRKAIGTAKVCLGLVRHANRDGHAMRSFEVPAMKGCFLVEKTQEHLEIFGEDKQNVIYFESIEKMLENTQWLLNNPQERTRLAENSYQHMIAREHTYTDRLKTILL